MSTDATHHGHAARAGNPATGNKAHATIAAPMEINTVVASGSRPPLIVAFQPAWQAAASRTAAKTNGSMARRIPGFFGLSSADVCRVLWGRVHQSRNAAPAHTFGAARWYCLGRATPPPTT